MAPLLPLKKAVRLAIAAGPSETHRADTKERQRGYTER